MLEVADIFHDHGAAWRRANAGHVSLDQMKVMSAIERCRTAALGGHVARCEDCAHTVIAYNSCRNRHCPKCQGAAAQQWLAEREAELLPVGYFHVVFTLPTPIADIAYHNKAVIYDLLFKASAESVLTIAADPKHLGAHIGITAVLHTWGSTMTHHPHIHMIVPGGGVALDGKRWLSCGPNSSSPCKFSRSCSDDCSLVCGLAPPIELYRSLRLCLSSCILAIIRSFRRDGDFNAVSRFHSDSLRKSHFLSSVHRPGTSTDKCLEVNAPFGSIRPGPNLGLQGRAADRSLVD